MPQVVRQTVAKESHPLSPMIADAKTRLVKLATGDMPWLSPRGRKILADVPEASGPAKFKKLP